MGKVSLIATVLNEAGSVAELLNSVLAQSRQPDEVVIVDGGSGDGTLDVLRSFSDKLPLRILVEPGCNISQGRNLAIESAQGPIIACTDAGVHLDPQWLAELVKPLEEELEKDPSLPSRPDVACGFFLAEPRTVFESTLGATVLPDIEEINPNKFLPSSRSVAFTKEAWQQVGGYPEWLDYCEDLVFDFRLHRAGFRFAWVPSAIVHFRPRLTLSAFFRQYYRYARGDGKADLWFWRHLARYSAYTLALPIVIGGFWFPPLWGLAILGGLAYLYRPYKRLLPKTASFPWSKKIAAILYVPPIRLCGDLAKMAGYPVGVFWRMRHHHQIDMAVRG